MANFVHRYAVLKMFYKKSAHKKSYQDKTTLDNILWFVENYLPQKKKISSSKKFYLENLKSLIKVKKLNSSRYKSLKRELSNTKITFTISNLSLPHFYFLKKIKFRK